MTGNQQQDIRVTCGAPTPVFLPGECQGRGSLVGCRLWGRTESDTAEATRQQQQQHAYKSLLRLNLVPPVAQQAPSQVPAQEKRIHVATKNTRRNPSTSIHYSLNVATGMTVIQRLEQRAGACSRGGVRKQGTTEARHLSHSTATSRTSCVTLHNR